MGCTKSGEHWDRSIDDLLIDAVDECVASVPGFEPTAPAMFSLLAPPCVKKYGISDEQLKEVITRIAWKNHRNGALNERAQFRSEVAKETIACSPIVAGSLGIFDCSGVSDGAAAALIVRAQDAHQFTDKPTYVKALSFVSIVGAGRDG
jgi:acetyl-CoA C-acetyltransferase